MGAAPQLELDGEVVSELSRSGEKLPLNLIYILCLGKERTFAEPLVRILVGPVVCWAEFPDKT